jgi:hypothetical protein
MSGELMTLEASGYLALQPGSDALAAIEANCADGDGFGESNLTKVPTPAGGATSWEVDELEGSKSYKSLDGILVFYGKGGVIWPTNDPKPGTLPVLRTDDCRTAYRVGEDIGDIDEQILMDHHRGDGLYDWKALADSPNAPFGFGSGKNGHGKRAQEYRVICLLRQGDAFPLLIRAKPGSLKNVSQFINRLTAAGVPYYRAVVSLTLEKAASKGGQPFSRIVPKLLNRLDQEAGQRVKAVYTDRLSQAIRSLDVGGIDEGADD